MTTAMYLREMLARETAHSRLLASDASVHLP
jgi:hypothetical protein